MLVCSVGLMFFRVKTRLCWLLQNGVGMGDYSWKDHLDIWLGSVCMYICGLRLKLHHVWHLLFLIQPNEFNCFCERGCIEDSCLVHPGASHHQPCLAQKDIVCIHVLMVQQAMCKFVWECITSSGNQFTEKDSACSPFCAGVML